MLKITDQVDDRTCIGVRRKVSALSSGMSRSRKGGECKTEEDVTSEVEGKASQWLFWKAKKARRCSRQRESSTTSGAVGK